MIYMRNITITTAKSATYLENVGSRLYGVQMRWVDVAGPHGETRRGILPAFAGIEAT